jgi:hypothetical protein
MSMVALLAVVALLMFRARDPNNWRWLASDKDTRSGTPAARPAEGKAPAAGPTDEDPEQRAEANEEFQAVTDGTLGIQSEESFAYWRLLYWAEHQSPAQLEKRVKQSPSFAELMQFPQKFRARLIRLNLNVRRVLTYDVEDDNPLGVKRLYEIWGFTDDSKAWLYCVVTTHLPEGMPLGAEVEEQGRFVGYFFKLQGYLEAGAKPRAAALRAPLVVGRFTRYTAISPQPRPVANPWDWSLLGGLGALGACAVWAIVAAAHRRALRRRAGREAQTRESVRNWLQSAFPAEDAAGTPEDGRQLARANGDGQSEEHL